MTIANKSWWFLFGVLLAPYFVLILHLEGFWLLRLDVNFDLDLICWIWFSLAASLAAGIFCVWRLPLHWFLRLDLSILYALFVGFSLLLLANLWASNRFGG